METWFDIILLAALGFAIGSVAVLIMALKNWLADREYRRNRENFQRRLRQ